MFLEHWFQWAIYAHSSSYFCGSKVQYTWGSYENFSILEWWFIFLFEIWRTDLIMITQQFNINSLFYHECLNFFINASVKQYVCKWKQLFLHSNHLSQAISLIDEWTQHKMSRFLIRFHFESPLNMKPLLSVYLKLIEWKVLSKVATVQVIQILWKSHH